MSTGISSPLYKNYHNRFTKTSWTILIEYGIVFIVEPRSFNIII